MSAPTKDSTDCAACVRPGLAMTGVLRGDGAKKMRTAGAVLIFWGFSFLQYQQQAQGYEELFIGFFPEEQEQQQ